MVRCEFCHQPVPLLAYPSHRARHLARLPDGQQEDYSSLPPETRHQGPIDDAPRVYVHLGCGGRTVMQEKIVRSYLADPFLYDDLNFCTGCGRHVRDRVCVWEETGEGLHEYFERLRQAALARRGRLGRLWLRLRRLRVL